MDSSLRPQGNSIKTVLLAVKEPCQFQEFIHGFRRLLAVFLKQIRSVGEEPGLTCYGYADGLPLVLAQVTVCRNQVGFVVPFRCFLRVVHIIIKSLDHVLSSIFRIPEAVNHKNIIAVRALEIQKLLVLKIGLLHHIPLHLNSC